ncbi:MAG: hypothetical protein E7031_08050 [Akkermansiaceae bacterium]|nr:hypothetical protein [Akkermansiaceae bacterium]
MNPNSAAKRNVGPVILGFFIITLGCVLLFGPSGDMYVDAEGNKHVPGFFNDAVITYADQICGENPVTDWHSALYMYEGRAVHSFLESLTVQTVDGYLPQRVMMWVADILVLVNMSYWLALLLHRYPRACYMALPMGVCMLMLHFTLGVSLDFFFVAILFSSISLSFLLYTTKKKWVLIVSVAGLIVLLYHMVEYRRNAALVLPIFIYLLVARLMPSCRIALKAGVGGVVTLAFYWFSTHFITLCGLPVEDRPSLLPMVESDLRIAAILDNRRAEEWALLPAVGLQVTNHEYRDSITAYWAGANVAPEDWDRVWEYYLYSWKNNTGNMLMARVLQLSQFYWSGGTPWAVEKMADAMYPQMTDNPKRWTVLFDTDVKYLVVRLMRLAITLSTIIICLCHVWRWLVRHSTLSPEQYAVMIITGAATAYSLSYVVVTPTSDLRYLLPAQVLGIITLCYLFLKKRASVK